MIAIQLDFLQTDEQSELEALKNELDFTYKRLESVRKGMYARLNEQSKDMEDLKNRLNIIEKNICHVNGYI